MRDKTNFDMDYTCVEAVFNSRCIGGMKEAAAAFIAVADEVRETLNGMYVYMLCERLKESVEAWSERYKTPAKGSAQNAVIVLPEYAPIMYLPSCVPLGGRPIDVVAGMKKFVERCDEFTEPICDAITVSEMKRVLTSAQKTYRLLDVIAPDKPLLILRFDNSHKVYNSQCAIPCDSKQTVIFSFHPNDTEIHDRVFIFAHELGHALHLALTHDINAIPEKFDEFNEKIGVKFETLKEKQEGFADSAALAILNAKGLGTHQPTYYSKFMSGCHGQYLRWLCANALKAAGRYTEPLPQPNMSKIPDRPPR
jgi:hypothetical protein